MPWLPFYLATRSQDGYFLLMTPLWLAAAATVPSSSVANAWQPRIRPMNDHRAKAALAAGLFVPAFLSAAIAVASPPPLRLSLAPRLAVRVHEGISSVLVRAENTTDTALSPHFASRTGQGASSWWAITSGPTALRPHASAEYVVQPPGGFRRLPDDNYPGLSLIAVTDRPMTITTARFESATCAVHGRRPERRLSAETRSVPMRTAHHCDGDYPRSIMIACTRRG